ncbi:MAG: MutS-related protein, partial [Limisphaerales bacterium]
MIDPKAEYQSRLAEWSQQAQAHEQAHLRVGNLRLFFVVGLVILAVLLVQTRVGLGITLTIVLLGLFLSGMVHDRILKGRERARRAMGFYQAGLNRLDGNWAGKGSPGTEFLDPHHPYASDLDLFGGGSLFELLNTTQTESGRVTLAAWLLASASPEEIHARQEAVEELRPKMDLRERLGLIAAEAQAWIRTEALIAWASQPRVLESNLVRVAAFCLPLASLPLFVSGFWVLSLAVMAGQFALMRYWGRRVHRVVREAGVAPRDLEWLAEVLRCLDKEAFNSERLRRMEAEGKHDGFSASEAIQRLGKLYGWTESGTNLVFVAVCRFFLWDTQFAFAIEAWRARFGPKIEVWLRRLAEFEALSSLACYSFEHPADSFPELLPATAPAQIEAEGLGHPLIPESRSVGNDIELGSERRLIVISGSNMSGKSTW